MCILGTSVFSLINHDLLFNIPLSKLNKILSYSYYVIIKTNPTNLYESFLRNHGASSYFCLFHRCYNKRLCLGNNHCPKFSERIDESRNEWRLLVRVGRADKDRRVNAGSWISCLIYAVVINNKLTVYQFTAEVKYEPWWMADKRGIRRWVR